MASLLVLSPRSLALLALAGLGAAIVGALGPVPGLR
jgi:hypothetical protein